jgi:hypothetical protein
MKKKIIIKFLVFIMPCFLIAQQYDLPTYDATVMPWSKEYWYQLSPSSTTLTQDMSGEDWPYRVIKDGSGTSAKYVLVGYARGTGEDPGTCKTNHINYMNNYKVGGTIVKLDNDGDILWSKLYAEKSDANNREGLAQLTELHGLVKTTEIVEGISTEYYIATGFTSILHRFPHNQISTTIPDPLFPVDDEDAYTFRNCTRHVDDIDETVFFDEKNLFHGWVNGDNRRVIYVVKVKASDGSIVWERTYNTANASDYTSSACDNYRAMGWDIEVLSNGNYLVVGCAPNMSVTQNSHWKNAGQSTKNMQMYMMELKPNGERVWIQIYDPAAGTGFTAERWSVAYSIARKPNTNDFAITGRFLTDQGWALPIVHGGSAATRSRCFVGKFTYAGGGTAPTITYKALNNTTFDAGINDNLNNLATEVDFSIEADPKILVPMISNCTECYDTWTGDAEGRVIALDYSALTKAYCTNALPDIESFDLRMGITPTSDGGSAVISSKIPFRLPFLARKFDWRTPKVGSDATAAKLNASGVVTKCMTFDAQNVNGFCPKDGKEQECLYSIVENVESGTPYYVICGNTSSNADDHYAVKFKFECPSGTGISDIGGNTDLTSIIRPSWKKIINSSAYSSNPSTSNVIDIRAGKTIHLTPGFRAQSNGGVTHLHIDTFRCDECD